MEKQLAEPEGSQSDKDEKKPGEDILRSVTGWALLAASAGTFFDAFACGGCLDGSIGLIPLYLGFPIGALGLVLMFQRTIGRIPTVLLAIGLAGILFFMFSYPDGAEGWIGGVFIGIAHLFLPRLGRLASVLWIIAGIWGFPELDVPSWGVISAFTLFGAATAASGTFVLWGLKSTDHKYNPEESKTA